MGYDKGSKANRKTTLEQIEKTTGIKPKKLEMPCFPVELAYLWSDFFTIKNACQSNISFSELDAFCRLSDITLKCWETDILMKLDLIYRERLANG